MKKEEAAVPSVTGSRIKCVRRMTKKEVKANGFSALAIVLNTGVRLFAQDIAGEFEEDAFWLAPERK